MDEQRTNETVILELQELVGLEFPMTVQVRNGEVTKFEYLKAWKETVENEDPEAEIEYKECSLTQKQVDKVEAWVKENVKA